MKKAVKSQKRLRMALSGASGSGKTRSALEIAKHLGGSIGLIDTEYKSASAYADKIEFDVDEIVGDYQPDRLIKSIETYGSLYDILIIDSLTHFWNGKNGMLDLADQEVKKMIARGGKPDTFAAWKVVTPIYNRVVQTILSAPCNIICTMRAKQEYSREGGKVQKLGISPEMRDGFSFEMDVEGLLNEQHDLVIGKTRFDSLDGKVFHKPGKEVADLIIAELNSGSSIVVPEPQTVVDPPREDGDAYSALRAALEAAKSDPDALKVAQQAAVLAKKENRITDSQYGELGKLYLVIKKAS